MANTAALLGTLLNTNADINYYTQQQIYWSNKYDANAKKLSVQVKQEEVWEAAYDDVMYNDGSKAIKKGNTEYVSVSKDKSGNVKSVSYYGGSVEAAADAYAHAKAAEYDAELSLELADLDMEYDTMKTMYETLLEKLRADQDAEKNATSTAAQDTGLLQG